MIIYIYISHNHKKLSYFCSIPFPHVFFSRFFQMRQYRTCVPSLRTGFFDSPRTWEPGTSARPAMPMSNIVIESFESEDLTKKKVKFNRGYLILKPSRSRITIFVYIYISPLVMTNIAIEHGNRNNKFSNSKW